MKKLILTAIVAAGISAGAYAQGTVLFQNYTFGTVFGQVLTNTVAGTTNGAVAIPTGATVNLELFYGPLGDTAAQLLALNTGAIYTTTIASGAAGHFNDGTTVTTTGPAGAGSSDVNNVELLITGWIGNAANYNAAVTAGQNSGQTLAFGNPTGGGGSPAAAAANMVNWTLGNSLVIAPVPEPGTILLGGLGAASLLLFRRRK